MSGISRGETSTSYRIKSLIKTVVEEAWALAFLAAGYLWRPRAEPWSSPGGLRVLVVAPHPDDEVAGCGGAILLHRARSDHVCVVYVTDGRRSRAGGLDADEMARRRRAEAAAGARALDVSHVEWLGLPEGDWSEHELNSALTAVLDRHSPDVIYAPSRIDFHPEHYRVARCLAAALESRRAAAVPAIPTLRIYQVQVPLTPVLTTLVATTASVEAGSLAALRVYVTQLGSLLRCLRMKRYAARWWGVAGQAEEFWELTAAQYCALHRQQPTRPLVRTFRGLRSFALTDPLAYGRGLLERRRLALAARRLSPIAMVQQLPPLKEDPIAAVPWHGAEAPSRVLVIRLQAFGDTVATLPYVSALKRLWIRTEFDLLTREDVADLPRSIDLFTNVFALRGRRDWRRQLLFSLLLLRRLIARRYEVVVDLQRNRVSHFVRRVLRPPAWSEYDRYSPRLGGERTRLTIEALGVRLPPVYPELRLRRENVGLARLRHAGWSGGDVVVLNPAGAFPTRNWPLASYVAFADMWRARRGHEDQFAVLGTPQLRAKADYLKATLGERLLDLVGRTSATEAFDILRRATLVVSEDSGLMHLAWVAGAPTVGLFGSSRHVWSAPHGNYSVCLHSGDLPCGACMDSECRFGDVHCLTRYTPERVVEAALSLLQAVAQREKMIWPGTSAEP